MIGSIMLTPVGLTAPVAAEVSNYAVAGVENGHGSDRNQSAGVAIADMFSFMSVVESELLDGNVDKTLERRGSGRFTYIVIDGKFVPLYTWESDWGQLSLSWHNNKFIFTGCWFSTVINKAELLTTVTAKETEATNKMLAFQQTNQNKF